MQTTKSKKRSIDDEIFHMLQTMEGMTPGTENYKDCALQLKDLCEARSKKKATRLIEPEAILVAVTNIAGILLILNYEHLHVVSSKALGFIAKGGRI